MGIRNKLFLFLIALLFSVPAALAGGELFSSPCVASEYSEESVSAKSTTSADGEILYNSTAKYFYFVDGKYPQSYVGDGLNTILKTNITADVSPIYTLKIGGEDCNVFEYNGEEYMQLLMKKEVTINLDSTTYTFQSYNETTKQGVYYFKVEPIVWRVSDYGVSETDYPSWYKEIRGEDINSVVVSDLVLHYDAVENESTYAQWRYINSYINSNISANFNEMESGFSYAGQSTYFYNYFNKETSQKPVSQSSTTKHKGLRQTAISELNKNFSNNSAKASDLVCVLAGINDTENALYTTRDLQNIDNGTAVTSYGVTTGYWLQQQAGTRLSYTYKLPANVAILKNGIEINAQIKGKSYSTVDTTRKKIVYDYYTSANEYFVDSKNVIQGLSGTDVSKNNNGMVRLYNIGTTSYILSEKPIYSPNPSYSFFEMQGLQNVKLNNFHTAEATDFSHMFRKCVELASIEFGVDERDSSKKQFVTDNATTMRAMFYHNFKLKSLDVSFFNTSKVKDMHFMFNQCQELEGLDVSNFDTSSATDIGYMFSTCYKLTSLNLSSFDTAKVTNMEYLFSSSTGLQEITFGGKFVTSNVTTMHSMFYRCEELLSLDVSSWNTTKVKDMMSMFYYCEKLTYLDLRNFNTANVTTMNGMFRYCNLLETILWNDEKFNTAKVTDMSTLFYHCESLTTFGNDSNKDDITINFDTSSVKSIQYMFNHCRGILSLKFGDKFDTSKVTDMSYMFSTCSSMKSVDVSSFDTTNVTNMKYIFSNCFVLVDLDISNFDTSKVTDMNHMFYECNALKSIAFYKTGNKLESGIYPFNTQNVTNMGYMFWNCYSLQTLDLTSFNTQNVESFYEMFRYCSALRSISFAKDIDTSKVTNMSNMFSGCYGLTNLNLSNFDTSSVTSMYSMFSGCSSLTRLDFSNFNTSNVTNMSYMFSNCGYLYSVDFSDFDTSNVTNMSYMFSASGFEVLDLSNFNTTNVTNMSYMFYNCDCLYEVDFSGVDTSNVTNMSYMFYSCEYLYEVNFSGIDTSNVEYMNYMFYECSDLTSLDLSSFETAEVKQMSHIFANCSSLETIYVSDGWEINGGSLVNDFGYMFEGSTNLVGGEGTTYSDVDDYQGYVAPVYARIDGGSENPGLLTGKNLVGNTYNKKTFSLILKIVCGFCFSGVLSVFVLQFVQDKKKKVR